MEEIIERAQAELVAHLGFPAGTVLTHSLWDDGMSNVHVYEAAQSLGWRFVDSENPADVERDGVKLRLWCEGAELGFDEPGEGEE